MFQLLKNRSVISATGADALQFLQSLTTNDLENNQNSYNYLLSPQGKYLYDFFVSKITDEELLIDIDSSCVEAFIKKLNLYKLRKAVQLEDLSADYCVVYSKMPVGILRQAQDDSGRHPEHPNRHHELDSGAHKMLKQVQHDTYQDPRFHKLGFRSIIKTANITSLEVTAENLYIQDKYEFAIPDGVNDLIFDKSIPLHFGGEELSAISFTKGCYVGQEVISRAKYQGVVRKKIFQIKSGTNIAFYEIGTEITDVKGYKIGVFCSSYNNLGIVLLDEEKYLGLAEKKAIIGGTSEADIFVPAWRQ